MNSQGHRQLFKGIPLWTTAEGQLTALQLCDSRDTHATVGQPDVLTGPPGAPAMEGRHRKCPTMIKEQKTPKQMRVGLSHVLSCLS